MNLLWNTTASWSGFATFKDVLEVVVIPLAVLALGWLLPLMAEWRRRASFAALIRREISEAGPSHREPQPGLAWHEHMRKRFLHEEIFDNPSENRDFILSLDPRLTYNITQLWIHFEKGRNATGEAESLKEAHQFRDYLLSTCRMLDGKRADAVTRSAYLPWNDLIKAYEAQHRPRSHVGKTHRRWRRPSPYRGRIG